MGLSAISKVEKLFVFEPGFASCPLKTQKKISLTERFYNGDVGKVAVIEREKYTSIRPKIGYSEILQILGFDNIENIELMSTYMLIIR
jgi:hypothetical protein